MIVESLVRGTVYFIGYVLVVFVGPLFVGGVLSFLEFKPDEKTQIKGAGAIIGIIERIIAITFMFLSEPTAIAILFTAKSIIRFESTKDRPFAEYYLVGTMSSVAFAIVIGALLIYAEQTLV